MIEKKQYSVDKAMIGRFREVCLKNDSILAAYLFGSAVKGKLKSTSDVDVAVLVEESLLDDFDLLSFMAELETICGRHVDAVLLNRADEVLKYQVRRKGCLIYERDATKRKRFEILSRKRFEDFLYLHRKHTQKALYGCSHGRHNSH